MRTKVLSVRIPADHWIFGEEDTRATVLLALRLYRGVDADIRQIHQFLNQLKAAQLREQLAEMRRAMDEIKSMLSSGVTVADREEERPDVGPGTDPRLLKSIDKFLDL